jgi:hypothetical protein
MAEALYRLYLVVPAQQHRKSVNSRRVAILSQNFTDTMAEDDDCSSASRRSTNSINNMLHHGH